MQLTVPQPAEITAQLLLHDIEKVYVLARTRSKFEAARQQWVEKRGLKLLDSERRAEFIPCDLGDILAAKRAADEIIRRTPRLDIVVCNAGTWTCSLTPNPQNLILSPPAIPTAPGVKPSPQNLDPILSTNHVGHHTLVTHLLPLLAFTAITYSTTPRIIITTSSLHHFCRSLSIPSLSSPKPAKWPASYDAMWRYARSKLCNILFTKELSHRLAASTKPGEDQIFVNCYFPGNIATDAMDTWKMLFGALIGWGFKTFFRVVGQGVDDAAATVLFLATSEDVVSRDLRGKYFVPVATEASVSKLGEDVRLASEVWDWTEDVIRNALR